jgi:ubiquitin thioesterase protein OTUB1
MSRQAHASAALPHSLPLLLFPSYIRAVHMRRRTRGDGNCFYRGFLYGYLASLIGDPQECQRFVACLRGWKSKLVHCGFQELVFEDALDLLLDQCTGMMTTPLGGGGQKQQQEQQLLQRDLLLASLRDDMSSNLMVMMLRLVTSGEVRGREEHFAPFIMGMYEECLPTDLFCQRHVEPMGEASDHVQIIAITDALQVREGGSSLGMMRRSSWLSSQLG